MVGIVADRGGEIFMSERHLSDGPTKGDQGYFESTDDSFPTVLALSNGNRILVGFYDGRVKIFTRGRKDKFV